MKKYKYKQRHQKYILLNLLNVAKKDMKIYQDKKKFKEYKTQNAVVQLRRIAAYQAVRCKEAVSTKAPSLFLDKDKVSQG